MKQLNIEGDDLLQITHDEKLFLTGKKEFLKIHIDENVHAKILLFNPQINFLKCNIAQNSSLDCDFISLHPQKKNLNFDLHEHVHLDLKIISTQEIEEDTTINLNEEGANFHGEYLIVAKDSKNFINTQILHNAPRTYSDITNFGIALKEGRINFETVGKVEKGKSKSFCRQLSRGIILDEKADITTQPILLIDEYDVQAHHGVTIGKISEDELFFLMARGLTKKKSEQLVVSSFIKPFLENLPDKNVRGEVEKSIFDLVDL